MNRTGHSFSFFRPLRARAKGKIKLVRLITTAALKDWRAAAFLLERCFPEEFGRIAPREQFQPNESEPEKQVSVTIVAKMPTGEMKYVNSEALAAIYEFPTAQQAPVATPDAPEIESETQEYL